MWSFFTCQSKWPLTFVNFKRALLLVLLTVALLTVGYRVWQLFSHFQNDCEMTYMYQKPQYIEIDLPEEIHSKYPDYGLFVYGEGSYASALERGSLTGVPLLYIPGNGATHKLARCPGSVALLMHPKEFSHHKVFNVFTVSLNEELSGLYGGVLEGQARFVALCIRHILSLYQHMGHPPSTVPLVGHSMGGVVARGLFTLSSFSAKSVNLLITLSSPHLRPSLPLDGLTDQFYTSIEESWQQGVASHVTVVSFGSGPNDYQVLSDLTRLTAPNSINIPSLGIPRVWASTDHYEILWCRRLELTLLRVLFQLQNGTGNELTSNQTLLRRTFCQHFLNPCAEIQPSAVPLPSLRVEPVNTSAYISQGHTQGGSQRFAGFKLFDSSETKWLVLTNAAPLLSKNWLFACNDSTECVNLSPLALSLPPIYDMKNKMLIVDVHKMRLQQLLVLESPRTDKSYLIVEPYYESLAPELALPILAEEFNLRPLNHLMLLPLGVPKMAFVFVQRLGIQVSCSKLDSPSLDFVIAGIYPQGQMKVSTLKRKGRDDLFLGQVQLSWLPENWEMNKSLLIQVPSLDCKIKIVANLAFEDSLIQWALHNAITILKYVSSLLLLQVLLPDHRGASALTSPVVLGGIFLIMRLKESVYLPGLLTVIVSLILYQLLTTLASVVSTLVELLTYLLPARFSVQKKPFAGHIATVAAILLCLIVSNYSCGGLVVLTSLTTSVFMILVYSDARSILSVLMADLWGVLLTLPTIISWGHQYRRQGCLLPSALDPDPHSLTGLAVAALSATLVHKLYHGTTSVVPDPDVNDSAPASTQPKSHHQCSHSVSRLFELATLILKLVVMICYNHFGGVSQYLLQLTSVLYVKHILF